MGSPKKSQSSKSRENEALVLRVLERIASILLRLGFDAPNTEYLLRCAFVLAALRRADLAGGRRTQSEVALVAGVNRVDVRRIVAARLKPEFAREVERQSRIERIVAGWKQDPRFVDAKGRPKPLTIDGRGGEFSRLARTYGRDVTARTLRDTLVRNNLARVKGNKILLLEQNPLNNRMQLAGASDLSFLSDQLCSFNFHTGRRSFVSRHLSLPANGAKGLQLLQRKAVAKIETALGSLESIVLRAPISKHSGRSGGHRLLISTTLSSETDTGDLS